MVNEHRNDLRVMLRWVGRGIAIAAMMAICWSYGAYTREEDDPASPGYLPDAILIQGPKTVVDGSKMQAFVTAYDRVKSCRDLQPPEKKLDHYTVGFNEDADAIYVWFSVKPIPGEPIDTIGGNRNGQNMLIKVWRSTGKIVAFHFLS